MSYYLIALLLAAAQDDPYQQHLEAYHYPWHQLPAPPQPPRRYYLDPSPRPPVTFDRPFRAKPSPPKTIRFMDQGGKATTCYIYSSQTVFCY